MMSIMALGNLGKSGASAKLVSNYYEEKSADYYLKEKESPLEWLGDGAKELGLSGVADKQDFRMALAGYAVGNQVQNAGLEARQMGWDATFSAPKSVSVAWALADPDHKAAIEQSHKMAVGAAMSYLQDHATTRRGHDGKESEPVALIAAAVTHYTSRAGDPQLHTHVVIPNIGLRRDGTVGTVQSHQFYETRLAAGSLYQAELAYRMREMGYEIDNGVKGTFRLANVDQALEQTFSKRGEQIKAVSLETGREGVEVRAAITAVTRPDKVKTSLMERESHWIGEAKGVLLQPERVERGTDSKSVQQAGLSDRIAKASAGITESKSVFLEHDLIRETAKSSYGQYSAEMIRDAVAKAPGRDLVVKLNNKRYTTPEMVAIEQSIAETAKMLVLRPGYRVDEVNQKSGVSLSDEQRAAVLSATGNSALAVIQGRAGVGKTTSLAAIHDAYKAAGYQVEGVALSGQAAKVLGADTGMETRTIASWIQQHEMNSKTVLIVDEAGMVGSKMTEQILQEALRARAKVILVGDERQLQPIAAGSALQAVDRVLIRENAQYSSQILTIRRQKEAWMKDTVRAAAEGRIGDAIDYLHQHKKIHIDTNAISARAELVKDFLKEGTLDNAVVLTMRRSDAHKINKTIREALQSSGQIRQDAIEFHNGKEEMRLAVGDRVMLGKNEYKLYDVRNADRGVVTGIDDKTKEIVVQFDNGIEKKIATSEYEHIHYGWAMTTHKAQGLTVDKAYVYGHSLEAMATAETAYVQISRSREETRLYIVGGEVSVERPADVERSHLKNSESSQTIKDTLEEMKRSWSKSGAKDTTLDYQKGGGKTEKTFELTR